MHRFQVWQRDKRTTIALIAVDADVRDGRLLTLTEPAEPFLHLLRSVEPKAGNGERQQNGLGVGLSAGK